MLGLNSSLNHDSIVEETASKNILGETGANIGFKMGDPFSLLDELQLWKRDSSLYCYLGQISLRGKYGKLQSHLMEGLWSE